MMFGLLGGKVLPNIYESCELQISNKAITLIFFVNKDCTELALSITRQCIANVINNLRKNDVLVYTYL